MEGKLHIYHPKRRLNLFEYASPSSTPQRASNNILLFIGGMFDNFRNTSYVDELAEILPDSGWRVCHVQLSSATRNFGTFSLGRDVEEIATCIDFIRSTPDLGNTHTKVVLLGHSTGCQDALTYIHSPSNSSRQPIQGAILQAAVSDREGAIHLISTKSDLKSLYDKCLAVISKTPKDEHKTTILPMHWTTPIFGPAPMSISRFLSLVSPGSPANPSADDLFSSDIPDSELAKTFGKVGSDKSPLQPLPHSQKRSILVVLSGADEHCPAFVDKSALLSRWQKAAEAGGAGLTPVIVDGALHDMSGSSKEQEHGRKVVFKNVVLEYLNRVLGKDAAITTGVSELKL
jgi:Protein of unknown function (DUF1749)